MLRRALALLLVGVFSLGCNASPVASTPQLLHVYASSATYPWLDEVYGCAPTSTAIELSQPDAADLKLRLGEASNLDSPAFQVGSDDLLVVVQPQTGIGSMTLAQVRQIFAGQVTQWSDVGGADIPVQVWTYSAAEDVQVLFVRTVMHGQPISSMARIAASAQSMSDSVGTTTGSIGFLPRRWKTGNTNSVLTVMSAPVLGLTASTPQGALRDLIACLQSKE